MNNMALYINLAIFIFLLYNTIIGFRNGLMKSLFFSFNFLVRVFSTYIVYNFFYDFIIKNKYMGEIVGYMHQIIVKALPNLSIVSDMLDRIILVFIIYIIVSIIVVLIFAFSKKFTDAKELKGVDRFFGACYGFLKASVYIMFVIYIFDRTSDVIFDENIKAALTGSSWIVPFYTYNIFMHMFGI